MNAAQLIQDEAAKRGILGAQMAQVAPRMVDDSGYGYPDMLKVIDTNERNRRFQEGMQQPWADERFMNTWMKGP